MDSLMNNDSGSTVADLHTKRYYRNHGGFLWVDRHGIDHRADTLLTYLQKVDEMGFKTKHFYVNQITARSRKTPQLESGGRQRGYQPCDGSSGIQAYQVVFEICRRSEVWIRQSFIRLESSGQHRSQSIRFHQAACEIPWPF